MNRKQLVIGALLCLMVAALCLGVLWHDGGRDSKNECDEAMIRYCMSMQMKVEEQEESTECEYLMSQCSE
jgi:hypothetical protein